jgi:ZIP family zinc transporter
LSTTELLLLAAIAGSTIFLGLPVGRVRRPMARTRALLNATAIGILVFLLFDVLAHANEPVETALKAATSGSGTWGRFAGLALVFTIGVGAGLLSLQYYDRWLKTRAGGVRPDGPGAATAGTLDRPRGLVSQLDSAHRLALFIALGIGLHNFSEGLAIGQAAGSGAVKLAGVLIVGFALHNGTEGFGIVAPFADAPDRPSWKFLALMGAIGGGPTFLGTVVGRSFINETLFLAFLALAAGSILYVIVQLLKAAQRIGFSDMLMWGLLLGLTLGFATDYVLVAAGG